MKEEFSGDEIEHVLQVKVDDGSTGGLGGVEAWGSSIYFSMASWVDLMMKSMPPSTPMAN